MTPHQVLSLYSITYENGITQKKWLIAHEKFMTIMKPLKEVIYDLEIEYNKVKNLPDKTQAKIIQTKISGAKLFLFHQFSDSWFTDQSPYYEAITTGELRLLPQQGGIHQVKIIEL